MTQLSSIPPVAAPETAAASTTGRLATSPSPPATPSPPQTASTAAARDAAPTPGPQKTASATAAAAAGIPYQLHFDAETQRYILEARDPHTGAIVATLPPQSVLQQIQLTAEASGDSPLGQSVDQSA
jgi:hypothetical protein